MTKRKKRVLIKQFEGYMKSARLSVSSLEGCLKKIKLILKEIEEL